MYAKMAAERGKSIMLEKPAARTLFEVEKVYSHIEKVPLYVYSQRSDDESIDVGREIINSGKLGRIKSFNRKFRKFDAGLCVEQKTILGPKDKRGWRIA